jgi:hypothetical protein
MSDERRSRALEDLGRAVTEIEKLAGRVELGAASNSALAKELRALHGTLSMLVRALR